MSDSEAPKKDGALIRPATGRAQSGDVPAFFTEGALLRLEEGLCSQREQQEGRRFLEPDAPSPRLEIRTEEPVPSSFWRRGKLGLLLSALLLVVSAAALGLLLKTRTGGPTDAPVNIEASGRTASEPPGSNEARQPIADAGKSSAATATPSLPPDSNEPPQPTADAEKSSAAAATPSLPPDNHEPRQPTADAGKSSAATATPSLPPDNHEPRQPTTNAGKSSAATAMATRSLPPDNDEARQPTTNAGNSSAAPALATLSLPPLPRHRPMNTLSKRKGPPHQTTNGGKSSVATATPSLPRDNDEVGRLITKTGKSSAATPSLPPDGLTPSLVIVLRKLRVIARDAVDLPTNIVGKIDAAVRH